jgi:broad specificity phosphatase PhoE
MCVTTCHMNDSYAVVTTFAETYRPDGMPSLGDRHPAWAIGHARIGMEQAVTTRLLLVRHGQTHTSLDDAFCGVTEVPLTLIGRSQAQCLAERLWREHVDALYCSPQQRAQETAAPIGLALEMEIRTRNALREMDFGEWENRLRADLAREYPHELEEWERGSWLAHPPGGETQQAVVDRVVPCIVEILTSHVDQTVVVVSHKSVLRLLIGHLLKMTPPESRHLRLDPGSLSELRVTGDHVELVRCNDTSHLSL